MDKRTIGTTVTTYDNGSEYVLLVSTNTLENDPPFISIEDPEYSVWESTVFVESRALAEQLIELIRAAADEIWPVENAAQKDQTK